MFKGTDCLFLRSNTRTVEVVDLKAGKRIYTVSDVAAS